MSTLSPELLEQLIKIHDTYMKAQQQRPVYHAPQQRVRPKAKSWEEVEDRLNALEDGLEETVFTICFFLLAAAVWAAVMWRSYQQQQRVLFESFSLRSSGGEGVTGASA